MTNPVNDTILRLLKSLGKIPSPLQRKKAPTAGAFLVKGNMHDERTMSQLSQQNFSGIRANDIWMRIELWILGRVADSLSYKDFMEDPERLNKLYAETFGIEPVFTEGVRRDMLRLKERHVLLGDTDIQRALQAQEDTEKKARRNK